MKPTKKSPLFLPSFLPIGNGKLLDYDDVKTGTSYRYAQYNTRPIEDCPFRSEGCELICYATKGNHQFPSVKNSREKSFIATKRDDFADAVIYTILYHLETKRYKGNVMIVRIHESGDFYSIQYLRKWLKVWRYFEHDDRVTFCFYTKSFPFFLMLNDEEAKSINRMLKSGRVAISWSIDDTTSKEQIVNYLKCVARYPLANTYRCTETPENVQHDKECDCANCAKCGTCVKTTGAVTVVAIHSASKNDMAGYREKAGA